MKLIYATFAAAVMAAIAASEARADEPVSDPTSVSPYGKTVCEGRTWDYYLEEITPDNPHLSREMTGYHFSGTEVVGEQVYAVFRDAEENPLALMREEDRKLYLYVPGKNDSTEIGSGSEVLNDERMPVTGEVLLYDFSIKPGGEFSSVGFDDLNIRYGILIQCEVTSDRMFEFGGEEFTVQEFNTVPDLFEPDFKAIEGAGNVSGLLPYPQIANYSSGMYKSIFHLLRVTDADGDILYEDKNLLTTVSPYGKTVCEGRTWDYYLALGGYPEESRVLYGYHFDGVKAVGGQLYAVFCDGEDKPLALMREYAQKVYLYVPGQDEETLPGAHIEVGDKSGNVTGDVLLYDFSLEPRDRFVTPCFGNGVGDYGVLYDFEIMNTSTFDFNGESYCIQDFETGTGFNPEVFKSIEGVGNTSGLLPCPQMIIRVTGLNFRDYTPVRVTDDKLGVLYENDRFWAGVSAPSTDEETIAIYDILGRRVTVPVVGNIYIRDGKKILWK